MKIDVHGPNLPTDLNDLGSTHIHRSGCKDSKTLTKRLREEPWKIDVESLYEASLAVFSDVATDTYKSGTPEYENLIDEYIDDLYFAPCVRHELPRNG